MLFGFVYFSCHSLVVFSTELKDLKKCNLLKLHHIQVRFPIVAYLSILLVKTFQPNSVFAKRMDTVLLGKYSILSSSSNVKGLPFLIAIVWILTSFCRSPNRSKLCRKSSSLGADFLNDIKQKIHETKFNQGTMVETKASRKMTLKRSVWFWLMISASFSACVCQDKVICQTSVVFEWSGSLRPTLSELSSQLTEANDTNNFCHRVGTICLNK